MKSAKQLLEATLASVMFLSRLPVRFSKDDTLPDFAKTAHAFPLAGILIGLLPASVLWASLMLGLQSIVASTLCVIAMVIVTGALHEDGLADVADGFWGGHTRERKLEIMRDSAIGTYGVITLVLGLVLRILLIAALCNSLDALWAAVSYLAIASLSRLAMLQPWSALPAARTDSSSPSDIESNKGAKDQSGLSARYGSPNNATFIRGVVCTLPIFFILFLAVGLWPALLALVLMEVVIIGFSALCTRHIQGHTGDTLGATQQLSELGLLLGLILAI